MCGGLFSKPKVAAAPEPQKVVAETNAAAKNAAEQKRKQIAAAQGRRSLNSPVTGSLGVQETLTQRGSLFG